jgi:V8-like Glu-specific endopeptidase
MRSERQVVGTVGIGTGWLIEEDTVITAGHNLYNTKQNTHAIKVLVCVGYTKEQTTAPIDVKCEYRWAKAAAVHWGWYKAGQERFDFAVIRLESPFKDIRKIPFKPTPLKTETATKLRVLGYPGDLPVKANKMKGRIIYQSECPVPPYNLEMKGYQLEYRLDTAGGT